MLRLALQILWPSFMVAIAAEGIFFSLFDPRDLAHTGAQYDWLGAYTAGFFCFWGLCAISSLITVYLLKEPEERDLSASISQSIKQININREAERLRKSGNHRR